MSDATPPSYRQFPTTIWSLIHRAGEPELNGDAIGDLVSQYRPAMLAYVRSKWSITPEHAEDIVQGFIADKVLENRIIEAVDQRQQFRSFLATALRNYAISLFRKGQASKRGGGQKPVELLEGVMEDTHASPDVIFDREWARWIITKALHHMQLECEAADRSKEWTIFSLRIAHPILEGEEPPSYSELIEQTDLSSPSEASNLLTTAKRRYERCLRKVVGDYAGDDDAVDDEICDLQRILSQ